MGDDAHSTDPTAHVDFVEVRKTPRFQKLRRKHRSFVFPLAIFFLLWYFFYVLLAAYATDFMSIKVIGNINIGLIMGLLQFVTTFGITMWYVHYANKTLDPIAAEIRDELEHPDQHPEIDLDAKARGADNDADTADPNRNSALDSDLDGGDK